MSIRILAKINAYSKVNVILPEPSSSDVGKVITVDEELNYVYMSPLSKTEVYNLYDSIINSDDEVGE